MSHRVTTHLVPLILHEGGCELQEGHPFCSLMGPGGPDPSRGHAVALSDD